jgi:hypothetical protein
MPGDHLKWSLTNFTLDNSYSVEMLEPGREFRLRYTDVDRKNRFDIVLSAVSSPRVWPGNGHLDQVMRAEGELWLRNQYHAVSCYSFRNRSWGEVRTEEPIPFPPISRLTGLFAEDFMFSIAGFDDPALKPQWLQGYRIVPAKTLKFGWVMVNGELLPVSAAQILTHFDPVTLIPRAVDINIMDSRGGKFRIEGTITAGAPFNTWPSVRTVTCQVQWRCGAFIGWGELINAQGNDFLVSEYCRT